MTGIAATSHTSRGVQAAPLRIAPLRIAPFCLGLLVAFCGGAGAVEVDYEIGVAAKHSDNINLSETNPISDTVLSPRLYFQAEQIGSVVQASAEGNLEYLHYRSDSFDDETRGRFAGMLNWNMLPQRLDFVVQDYLSLEPVDKLVAFAPNNQQQVNVFVAGPTVYARFGDATRGQFDLRYLNSYAEEDDGFDSDRINAAARLAHQFDATYGMSANVEATDVRFDLTGSTSDYRRYDGYINSTTDRQAVDLSVDLGYSRIEFDGSESESHPLARATLDWYASPRSRFSATVRHQLLDAAQSFILPLEFDFERPELDRRNFNDFRIPRGLVEPNVFRERLLRLRYRYRDERLDVQVAPYYRRIRYLEDLVDSQDRQGAILSLDYRLRPRLDLRFYAARERREFVDISRRDTDTVASIGLANRFTRHWTGQIDLQRRERDSTAPGSSYDENAVMISLSYRR